jgi:hypothetical protein
MKKFAPCRRPTLQAPPSVLVGMIPSGRVLPAATNGPLSPSPQNPSASSHCRAMKENPSYSPATPTSDGLRSVFDHIRLAAMNGDERVMSSTRLKSASAVVPLAQDSKNTGFCRRSRARSSVVKISAEDESTG